MLRNDICSKLFGRLFSDQWPWIDMGRLLRCTSHRSRNRVFSPTASAMSCRTSSAVPRNFMP